jgi:hypothetical protein
MFVSQNGQFDGHRKSIWSQDSSPHPTSLAVIELGRRCHLLGSHIEAGGTMRAPYLRSTPPAFVEKYFFHGLDSDRLDRWKCENR